MSKLVGNMGDPLVIRDLCRDLMPYINHPNKSMYVRAMLSKLLMKKADTNKLFGITVTMSKNEVFSRTIYI
jgi:hypothetical protein